MAATARKVPADTAFYKCQRLVACEARISIDCIKTERVTGGVDERGFEQGQRAMKIAPFAPTCINIDTKNGKSGGRGG